MNNNAIEHFITAVKEPEYETNTTYSAIVSRVDGEGVVWVNLAGSEKETPTASTSADVKAGDVVTVQWRNNKLYIAGNYSDPSAGVIRVANVEAAANTAREAANNAVADAGRARDAAEQAEATAQSVEGIAQRAENAATNAVKSLAQVEDVVDTLNWIATHCEYEKTTDTTIVTGKAYYTVTATQVSSPTDEDIVTYYELVSGEYVKTTDTSVVSGKTYYTIVGEPVTNPVVADIGTYYELDVTEAVSNYINTHVMVTDEGLWLVPDDTQGSNKVLIAVGGQGHTYEQAGTYIIDGNDNISAQFLEDGTTIYGPSNTLIAHLGYGSGTDSGGGTSDAPYYTLGTRIGTVGNNSTAEGYNTTASGYVSHAEGNNSHATGHASHAEGTDTYATGQESHAEGRNTKASGNYSHAEGYGFSSYTEASGSGSHAEGNNSIASGNYSHAEGHSTTASGDNSHAQNNYTIASKRAQTALGTYNDEDTSATTTHPSGNAFYGQYAVIVGNGTASNARSNALTVDWGGNICLALDTTAQSGTTDGDLYAAINALGWRNDVIV